jgi:hypothetical protein
MGRGRLRPRLLNRAGLARSGEPFDLARQFQVQVWLNKLEKQFRDEGVEEWLP